MTTYPRTFEIENTLPASEVIGRLNLSPEAVAPQKTSKPRWLRRLLLTGASLIALAGAAHFGYDYWTVGRFEVSTDDAYIKADNTTIAPKVSGYIAAVLVGDNEAVKAGQVLAQIDNRDYKVALEQAKAEVAAARAAVSTKQAALDAQQSIIEAARAALGVDQANQTFAEQDDKRYAHLATTGYGSVQNAQQAASRIAAAKASVARDQASLVTALKQVDVLKAELAQAKASVARSEAVQNQAELNLSYTDIVSPGDGVVGNRTLRVGQYVQAGTLICPKPPFRPSQVWAIRTRLQMENRKRDLALFNLAIDSKLRGCDVVAIRVEDVAPSGYALDRAIIRQKKTGRPVRFELTDQTRSAIDDYLRLTGRKPGQVLFCGRDPSRGLTTRQYARLVNDWVASIGLDPLQFGTHSLRRTKAVLIYRQTGNLRAVQLLLGHTKIESTVRYLGIEIDDAIEIAVKVDI